jgi:hypothetical protein
VYSQSAQLAKRFEKDRRLYFDASLAYAFSRRAVLWKTSLQHFYSPERRATWALEAGRQTADFAGARGMGILNMFSSLLFRVNYPAFYDTRYLKLYHTIDIANGLQLYTEASWQTNRQEINHTDFSVFYSKSRDYRPNIPRNAQVAAHPELLAVGRDFLTTVAISYTPRYYYRMHGYRKQMVRSDFPTFSVRWQRGWPGVFRSAGQFDVISLNVMQKIRLHSEARFNYEVTGGVFLDNTRVFFQNFRHFYSGEAFFSFNTAARPFQLLPSYTASANEWYAVANAEYKASYMALKFLPFLANTLMSERLSAAYLLTPQLRHYTEWGYSLTDIYFIGELGVFAGFEGVRFRSWGVRVAVKLDDL